MIHFVIRNRADQEPLALVRLNAQQTGDMTILKSHRHPRFGAMAPVHRLGRHVFNLMIGDNEKVEEVLSATLGYNLDIVTRAEWETFETLDLFPVLKLAVVR